MEFVRDLGMMYATEKSKRKDRFGIYICPECKCEVKALTKDVKRGKATMCKTCRSSINGKKNKGNKNCGRIHGHSVSNGKRMKLYNLWRAIKQRCYNKNDKAYKYYGAKGITICDEWLDNPDSFVKWGLENGYQEGLDIDKDIKFNGMYSPESCLFISHSENMKNRGVVDAHK